MKLSATAISLSFFCGASAFAPNVNPTRVGTSAVPALNNDITPICSQSADVSSTQLNLSKLRNSAMAADDPSIDAPPVGDQPRANYGSVVDWAKDNGVYEFTVGVSLGVLLYELTLMA